MTKAAERRERAPGSLAWRAVRVAAIVVLVVSVLTWFLVDPLRLPGHVLEGLNQRASVIGMFTGAVGLVVSMLGLRAQLRGRSPAADVASAGDVASAATGAPEPAAMAPGPRRRTVLLVATVPAAVVALIVLITLAVVRNAPVRYEAEDGAPFNAMPLFNIEGASGNASMGHLNYPDSWVEIKVQVPRAGTYTVDVRYRAGDGDARQYLTVNGAAKRIVHYRDRTWDTWGNATAKVRLDQGWNTLRFQHDEGPFAAELDYVEIA
ncbi:hypothetical protein GCM10009733_071400 [Nonomuraea maheshkhaliensis]|uniref:CBM6 domain-containing protein n=1 Tax=Nonomuraea maheshkhaliensis TaxID=419590 RepID=A0ABP4RWY4_9ACTN